MSKKLEIERKFLVKLPNSWLELASLFDNIINVQRIQQFFLKKENNEPAIRIRKLVEGLDNNKKVKFLHTKKQKTSNKLVHKEDEKEISEDEYNKYTKKSDPDKEMIEKTRFIFQFKKQIFELDIFKDKLEGLAILELELDDKDDKIKLPPFLDIVKEVTKDDKYSNYTLADKKTRLNQ